MNNHDRALAIFFKINDWLDPKQRSVIEQMHAGKITVEEAGLILGPNNAYLWQHNLVTVLNVLDVLDAEAGVSQPHAGQVVKLKDSGESVKIEFFADSHTILRGPVAIVRKLDGSDEQFTTLQSNLGEIVAG